MGARKRSTSHKAKDPALPLRCRTYQHDTHGQGDVRQCRYSSLPPRPRAQSERHHIGSKPATERNRHMVETPYPLRMEVELAYVGPAVEDGMMNVRDLAPAMYAVGNLFEAANLVFNGRTAAVDVSLRAIRRGSVDMVFQVLMEMVGTSMSSGMPYGWKSLWNLRDLLFGADGVIGVMAARNPDAPVDPDVQRLLGDAAVVQQAEEIVRPLWKAGIQTLIIMGNQQVTINQNYYGNALPLRSAPIEDEGHWEPPQEVSDRTVTTELEVVRPALHGKGAWHVSERGLGFRASMRDETFRKDVDGRRVQFSSGDTIWCDLRRVSRASSRWSHSNTPPHYEGMGIPSAMEKVGVGSCWARRGRQSRLSLDRVRRYAGEPRLHPHLQGCSIRTFGPVSSGRAGARGQRGTAPRDAQCATPPKSLLTCPTTPTSQCPDWQRAARPDNECTTRKKLPLRNTARDIQSQPQTKGLAYVLAGAQPKGGWMPAFGLVVNDRGEILLIQRGYGSSRGKWSLPGGQRDKGESLSETARRETYEETGIRMAIDSLYAKGSRHDWEVWRGRLIGGHLRVQKKECLDAKWFQRDMLPHDENLAFGPDKRVIGKWATENPGSRRVQYGLAPDVHHVGQYVFELVHDAHGNDSHATPSLSRSRRATSP